MKFTVPGPPGCAGPGMGHGFCPGAWAQTKAENATTRRKLCDIFRIRIWCTSLTYCLMRVKGIALRRALMLENSGAGILFSGAGILALLGFALTGNYPADY